MSTWRKLGIGLGVLLGLEILVCGFVGVWWFVSRHADSTNFLAALAAQTPTVIFNSATPTAARRTAPIQANGHGTGQALPGGVFGTVEAVNASTITIKSERGETVNVTAETGTRIIAVGVGNAGISDVKVGDKVLVLGVRRNITGQASVAPRVIVTVPSNYGRENITAGVIQSINGSSMTLRTRGGVKTVSVGAGAQFFGPLAAKITSADLKQGMPMVVIGETDANGGIDAELVFELNRARLARILQNRPAANNPGTLNGIGLAFAGFIGTVANVNERGVTVNTARGAERTVEPGDQTKVIIAGKPNGTTADIHANDKIIVFGVNPWDATPMPRLVIAMPADYDRRNVALGKIQSVGESQLAIKSGRGDLNVAVNGDTQMYAAGLQAGSSADLVQGDYVLVIGTADNGNALTAQTIITLPQRQR